MPKFPEFYYYIKELLITVVDNVNYTQNITLQPENETIQTKPLPLL
jgi:hypothetical protein